MIISTSDYKAYSMVHRRFLGILAKFIQTKPDQYIPFEDLSDIEGGGFSFELNEYRCVYCWRGSPPYD